MKKRNLVLRLSLLATWFFLGYSFSWAQPGRNQNSSLSSAPWLWQDRTSAEMITNGTRYIQVPKARNLSLDFAGMRGFLSGAPHESHTQIRNSQYLLMLPMPEGGFQSFRIVESPIMEPALQATFPQIRTYAGQGVEDPSAYIRLDATPQGFHAMILRNDKSTVYIDPYAMGDSLLYISYLKSNFTPLNKIMTCDFDAYQAQNMQHQIDLGDPEDVGSPAFRLFGDCTKRTYRLALAATGEYTTFQGGTVALAQAAQVTTMNRVNGVYNRDMAVQLNIVANNNLIVYTNSATDPYTNGTPGTMITQNQTNCDAVIGSANYDIGHVFGTNSGGLAGLGVICSNGNKARGVTGSGAPVGDPFDIDYVAHEMGHQFGANHTFNSNQGSCSGNQNNATAMEPGSGTTIMAYAGICGAHDVQSNSDDYFHIVSLKEIYARLAATSCAVTAAIPNNQPTLSPLLSNYTIPKSTPFVLTATATDPDNDPITYCWEQYDNATNTQPPVSTNTGGPQFRSWDPTTSNMRYIPRLSDLVTNTNYTWEVLPSVARNLRFGVYVRDNHTGGGCGDNDTMTVRVDGVSGPFVVTAPTNTGITWPALTTQTVTWNVAGTTAAPVSCANVNIYLSTDGGFTYPITLATGVPNNGTANVTVPNNPSTTCRVMVKGAGNIFFDISNNNFTITGPTSDFTVNATTTTQSVCAPTNATYTIAVGSIGGFSNPVTMSATNVPAGGTATFSPNPVTPGNNTTMTISGTGGIAPGSYTLTVTGTGSSGTHSTTVTLLVANSTPTLTLSTPTNGATSQSTTPTLNWSAFAGSTYDVQVATDAGFTNVVRSQTGLATNSWTVTPALNSNTTYYWRARGINGCGTGNYTSGWNFTTNNVICNSYVSTTVPRTISASGTPTVWDSVYVSMGGTITDVNVTNLVGTHTYISDLRVSLISPTGTSIVLFSGICTSNDNWDLKFDDAGTAYASIPCPPTSGLTYHPSGNLSSFNGAVPTGWWKLKIEDLYNADGGALTAWTLNICADIPCTLTASVANPTHVTCNGGSNGAATATPANGTGPYTYTWSNGQTNQTATNLSAGTYSVTVSGSGCNATTSVTINQPSAVTANASAGNTTCGLSNGTASVTPGGGSGSGYTYSWSNGANSPSLSNLASGSYSVTVTDAVGCQATASTSVGSSTGISASISGTTQENCGQLDGTASASGSGGTAPYSFAWSNGQTTQTAVNLAAGNYTVTVTDGAGCSNTAVATVPSSGGVSNSVSNILHTSCGQANGAAAAIPSGGSGNFTFLWSNGATSQNVNGLAAGTYTVTATDVSNGCQAVASVTINSSTSVSVAQGATSDPTCGANNGSIMASPTGGDGTYSYLWSDGQTTQTASNLGAGSYSVTVTDGQGCQGTLSVTLNASNAPQASTGQLVPVSCFGGNDGSITVAVTGGAPSYGFSWSNGATTQTINGLTAGTYTVTVTDANGCSTIYSETVVEPAQLSVTSTATDESAPGASDGTATANPAGGTPPYSFLWSDGQTTQTATGLSGGQYACTVTDANGCSTVDSVTVGTLIGTHPGANIGLDIFPNPSQGDFFISYELPGISSVEIRIFNKLGQEIFSRRESNTQVGKVEVHLPGMAAGVYSVEVRTENDLVTRKIVIGR